LFVRWMDSGQTVRVTGLPDSPQALAWSPDGRRLAFLSDRGAVLQAGGGGAKAGKAEAPKEGGTQVWVLPFADGGEARQLTDLPKDVEGFDWSPEGRRLAIVSAADTTEPEQKPERRPEDGPAPDTRLIDTLLYQFNGAGFVHERFTRIWIIDAETGSAELLTRGNHHDADPQWSPNGRQIAFVSDRHPNPDLGWRSDIYLVDTRGGEVRQLSP
jgi:Tol biopolymer transport system component